MSLKPPKKSDLNKSWMKARLDRERKIQPEYHLIVTEKTCIRFSDHLWILHLQMPDG